MSGVEPASPVVLQVTVQASSILSGATRTLLSAHAYLLKIKNPLIFKFGISHKASFPFRSPSFILLSFAQILKLFCVPAASTGTRSPGVFTQLLRLAVFLVTLFTLTWYIGQSTVWLLCLATDLIPS